MCTLCSLELYFHPWSTVYERTWSELWKLVGLERKPPWHNWHPWCPMHATSSLGMGPSHSILSTPSRPRFSLDLKAVPWTEGKVDQLGYAKSVRRWRKYRHKLPDNMSNKISKTHWGIFLLSDLYGREKDLWELIEEDHIASNDSSRLLREVKTSVVKCVLFPIGRWKRSDIYHKADARLWPSNSADEAH